MHLDKVYVSSARRGFYRVTYESLTSGCPSHGSYPGLALVYAVKYYDSGEWSDVDGKPQYWIYRDWQAHLDLTGGEPWRWYELDAGEVEAALERGAHIDDVRGFKTRCEPWQPGKFVYQNDKGQNSSVTCRPTEADFWERSDGWRVVKINDEIGWEAVGNWCNADRSVLKTSPHHFEPVNDIYPTAAEMMVRLDNIRPWN